MPGASFDRVADIYDATRGGERRGHTFADALAPWIDGPRVVELGIGTGVIAHGLGRHAVEVAGFDLSSPMLRAALARIGPRVASADIDDLPLPDASVDTAYLVWVLQLVDDHEVTLREVARIVRPGGRFAAILSNAEDHADDEIADALSGLAALRRGRPDAQRLRDDAPADWTLVHDGFTPWDSFPSSPSEQIATIEARGWSSLFDLDDATWAEVVEPVVERLRSLPEPDRPRQRRNRHPLLVWQLPA